MAYSLVEMNIDFFNNKLFLYSILLIKIDFLNDKNNMVFKARIRIKIVDFLIINMQMLQAVHSFVNYKNLFSFAIKYFFQCHTMIKISISTSTHF